MKLSLILIALAFSLFSFGQIKKYSCSDVEPMGTVSSKPVGKAAPNLQVMVLVKSQPYILAFTKTELKQHDNQIAVDLLQRIRRAEKNAADIMLYNRDSKLYAPGIVEEIRDYRNNIEMFRRMKLTITGVNKGYFTSG